MSLNRTPPRTYTLRSNSSIPSVQPDPVSQSGEHSPINQASDRDRIEIRNDQQALVTNSLPNVFDTSKQTPVLNTNMLTNTTSRINPNTSNSQAVEGNRNTRENSLRSNFGQVPSASVISNLSVRDLEILIANISRSVVQSERASTYEFPTQTPLSNIPQDCPPDLDKIPDAIKCLSNFSGDTVDFNSWRNSVERILALYQPLLGSAKYPVILSAIRNKIIGDADALLDSYNVPLEWGDIRQCLTLHYSDRRDINTIEFKMCSLSQGGKTTESFYQDIHSHLSLIINKISRDEHCEEAKCLHKRT